MACLGGFEPPTGGLEDRYSIQMSYRHIGVSAGDWTQDPLIKSQVLYRWATNTYGG